MRLVLMARKRSTVSMAGKPTPALMAGKPSPMSMVPVKLRLWSAEFF